MKSFGFGIASASRCVVCESQVVPLWINRGTRRRHADPNCRALALSEEMGADSEASGSYVRNRIYELPDDVSTEVLAAVEEFTVPCKLCVPGARAIGALVPFNFVVEGHEEEDWLEDDDEHPENTAT